MMNAKAIKKNLGSQTDWARLHDDDSHIDYSDIPATTKEFWKDAHVFMPTHKIHLSLRLDEDIVDYFKHLGKGYQSKINAVLKSYVNSHHGHSKHAVP